MNDADQSRYGALDLHARTCIALAMRATAEKRVELMREAWAARARQLQIAEGRE